MPEPEIMTTREAARVITDRTGAQVSEWQVRRLYERGILPEPPKFSGKRVIERNELPLIISAMRGLGWLEHAKPTSEEMAAV